MTDTCRVNNNYYDCQLYNSTTYPIDANVDNNLLFPLLNDASNWSVAIAKSKIDLSTIPLTSKNIQLMQYQLGLKYGSQYATAYVAQVNGNNNNYVWNRAEGSTEILKYQYTSSALTSAGGNDVSSICAYVSQFLIDDFSNMYVAGSNTSPSVADTLFIISPNLAVYDTLHFTSIVHLYIDRGQNLYVCDNGLVSHVNIYSNQPSETNVVLTLIATLSTTFANTPLTNLAFCVADNTIIVGYNSNSITIYNSQYSPISDSLLTGVYQLGNSAQISGTAGTFAVVDTNASNEELIGTSTNFIDIATNTPLTSGTTFNSGSAIVTGFSFGIGPDNFTYVAPFPSGTYPQATSQANGVTPIAFGCVCTNKNNSMYGIDTSHNFVTWNYSVASGSPNTWSTISPSFSAGATEFIGLDYQTSTNIMFAVGADNNLYSSSNPIAPQNYYWSNGSNAVYATGVWFPNSSGVMENAGIANYSVNSIFFLSHIGQYFYGVTYTSAFVVQQYNPINWTPTGISYPCTALTPSSGLGMISSVNTASGLAFIVAGNNTGNGFTQFALYNVTGGATISVSSTLPNGDTIGALCDLGDQAHVLVTGSRQTISNIYVYNYTTNPATLVTTFDTEVNSNTFATVNTNDLSVGGVATAFIVSAGTELFKITWPSGFSSAPVMSASIYSGVTISALGCNPNSGQVFVVFNNTAHVLYQSSGYNTSSVSTIPNLPTTSIIYFDPSIANTFSFSQVNTSGFALKSINVSRYAPNTLYAVGNSDSLLYQGTWNSGTNAVTFARITAYSNTYSYISSRAYLNPTINAKVDCFTISSQAIVGTPASFLGNVASLAKNDVTQEYLVANQEGNNLISYSASNFTQNWTQTLTGIYNIYAKNGETIDAGPADIYFMSVLIDAINVAFASATAVLNQEASLTLTSPVLSLNYTSGLCTLTYDANLYATAGNGILFNTALLTIIEFPSSVDSLSGLNLLLFPLNSEATTQTSKSIYLFNTLDKILFASDTIYVTGAYVGINQTTQVISDFDVPTTDFIENVGQILYIQPNFLRPYFLQSNLNLQRIQLRVLYATRDFSQYQLEINPNQNFTTKLQFIRKF